MLTDPKRDPFFEGLKADIDEGIAELDRGEGIPWPVVRERLVQYIEELMDKRRQKD